MLEEGMKEEGGKRRMDCLVWASKPCQDLGKAREKAGNEMGCLSSNATSVMNMTYANIGCSLGPKTTSLLEALFEVRR